MSYDKKETVVFVLFSNHKYLRDLWKESVKAATNYNELLNFKVVVFSRLFLRSLDHNNIIWKFKDVI